jgi:hypothetical protein
MELEGKRMELCVSIISLAPAQSVRLGANQ